MNFQDFLKTCTKKDGILLSQRSIEHYDSGLKVVSKDMMSEGVITKPLQDMELFELDLAIELILRNKFFQDKDKIGKRMYRNALKHFRLYVFTMNGSQKSEEKEVSKIEKDTTLTTTEKEAIVKARIGQGLYREKLLMKYSEGCIITHINIPEVLIASHIKPWSVSNNSERTSGENGFILSATYDRLFDRGLISFENSGKILLSTIITNDNAKRLELENGRIYDIKFNPRMKDFLAYHRDIIFIK